jgi:hypothetical protein
VAQPATAIPPENLYRVGRNSGLMNYSTISPNDATLPKAGNRFDVPGGRVLYTASSRAGCFVETLARFRPTPTMRELIGDEPGFMNAGGVPQDWRLQRSMATLTVQDPLPFLDVEAAATHAHLSDVLASELVRLGYADNLDLSDVTNQDRRLSRLIAQHAYTAVDEDGNPIYSGIRYMSRVGSQWECWVRRLPRQRDRARTDRDQRPGPAGDCRSVGPARLLS